EMFRFLKAHEAAELVPADRLFGQANGRDEAAGAGEVTVLVTSCGRQDLLEITLDSFLQYNTFPIRRFIVIEDGDGSRNEHLAEKYREHAFGWLATGRRAGQV